MTAKRVLIAAGLLFVIALAVIVGLRLSTEAMAVVIGVIFGVMASIPTSLLIMAVVQRFQERARQEEGYRERMQPPVIVVNPGGAYGSPWSSPPPSPLLPSTLHGEPSRHFRIVGDEDTILEGQWRPGGEVRWE